MKTKLLLLFAFLFIGASQVSYASFPVTRTATEITTVDAIDEDVAMTSPAAYQGKSMVTALLLLLFLGLVAAHRWYLGSPWYWNVLYIITLGGLGVWAIIDLIDIVTEKYPGL